MSYRYPTIPTRQSLPRGSKRHLLPDVYTMITPLTRKANNPPEGAEKVSAKRCRQRATATATTQQLVADNSNTITSSPKLTNDVTASSTTATSAVIPQIASPTGGSGIGDGVGAVLGQTTGSITASNSTLATRKIKTASSFGIGSEEEPVKQAMSEMSDDNAKVLPLDKSTQRSDLTCGGGGGASTGTTSSSSSPSPLQSNLSSMLLREPAVVTTSRTTSAAAGIGTIGDASGVSGGVVASGAGGGGGDGETNSAASNVNVTSTPMITDDNGHHTAALQLPLCTIITEGASSTTIMDRLPKSTQTKSSSTAKSPSQANLRKLHKRRVVPLIIPRPPMEPHTKRILSAIKRSWDAVRKSRITPATSNYTDTDTDTDNNTETDAVPPPFNRSEPSSESSTKNESSGECSGNSSSSSDEDSSASGSGSEEEAGLGGASVSSNFGSPIMGGDNAESPAAYKDPSEMIILDEGGGNNTESPAAYKDPNEIILDEEEETGQQGPIHHHQIGVVSAQLPQTSPLIQCAKLGQVAKHLTEMLSQALGLNDLKLAEALPEVSNVVNGTGELPSEMVLDTLSLSEAYRRSICDLFHLYTKLTAARITANQTIISNVSQASSQAAAAAAGPPPVPQQPRTKPQPQTVPPKAQTPTKAQTTATPPTQISTKAQTISKASISNTTPKQATTATATSKPPTDTPVKAPSSAILPMPAPSSTAKPTATIPKAPATETTTQASESSTTQAQHPQPPKPLP
ncbi:hypothetical protein Pelo_9757 [Pelomyxa schiedti]|nr:hypothetical protein Pelo_9757 [Pelomyxa schiedti]